jgi:hypothetical protein
MQIGKNVEATAPRQSDALLTKADSRRQGSRDLGSCGLGNQPIDDYVDRETKPVVAIAGDQLRCMF